MDTTTNDEPEVSIEDQLKDALNRLYEKDRYIEQLERLLKEKHEQIIILTGRRKRKK